MAKSEKGRVQLDQHHLEALYIRIGEAADAGDWDRFARYADAAEKLEAYLATQSGGKGGK